MATYTMPLKTIIEQPTQYRDDLTLKQRLEVGRVNLFKDMDYPIFNENYRSEFETKFIRYFYNKEIGFETESLFKFELETWLQINMPYYNQLVESELLEYDPLTNIAMQFDQDLKQDTTLDTTKDSQEDSTSNSVTQSSFEHDTQRDIKTDTTTDVIGNVKTQSDTDTTRDVTGRSETNTTQDSNTISKTDTTSNSDTNTKSDTKQDAFNRKIDSDTPDNRLHLSSNEGSGVIEYANNISETLDKSTGNTTTNTNTTDKSNSNTNTTDKTTSNSVTNTSENTDEHSSTTSNQDSTENTVSNSVTDDTTKQTGWDISETNAKGQIIGNIVAHDVGNKPEYIYNESYGKDGSITCQQMIQELGATFLRIERQIFREMTELFMLLY